MATRSMIFLQDEKDGNKFRYIYSHWDGYPEWNGRVLKYYYLPNPEKVEELVGLGDVSSIEAKIKDSTFYHRDYGEPWDQVAPKEGIFHDVLSMVREAYHWSAEYVYIFYRDGKGGFDLKCYPVGFRFPEDTPKEIRIPSLSEGDSLPFDEEGNPIGEHAASLAKRKEEAAYRRSVIEKKNKEKEEK